MTKEGKKHEYSEVDEHKEETEAALHEADNILKEARRELEDIEKERAETIEFNSVAREEGMQEINLESLNSHIEACKQIITSAEGIKEKLKHQLVRFEKLNQEMREALEKVRTRGVH